MKKARKEREPSMYPKLLEQLRARSGSVGIDPAQIKVGVVSLTENKIMPAAFVCTNSWVSRYDMSRKVSRCIKSYPTRIDIIVIEDYSMQRSSHTAFGIGELGGLVRVMAYTLCRPIFLCPPQSMRGFCGIPPQTKSKDGKLLIKSWAVEKCWFAAEDHIKREDYHYKKDFDVDCENITDAFVHAVIGLVMVNFEEIVDELTMQEKKVITSLLAKDARFIRRLHEQQGEHRENNGGSGVG